ncbi:MAG: hypothetical protein L0220_01265 [Acidobacteria bacterium]|nr:hypothetical protein [Acidobacteriota bacterium]
MVKNTAKPADSKPAKATSAQQIPSADLPRKALEDALKVAQVIKDEYAGKFATWEDIAKGMGFSPTNPNNKYFLWAATAYGIVEKDQNEQYRLTETGRKILAPTYDGERREGIIKAIAKPAILGRFYSDYGASLLPSGEIFRNVVEQKYGIPGNRIDETIQLILQNARFAELLEEQAGGKYRLRSGNEAIGIATPEPVTSAAVSDNAPPASDDATTDYKNACFIITPIGDDGSPERKHADTMLRHLISPVLEELKLVPILADQIAKPGHITKQVVENIAYCRVCITDLSFGNQNAHYELGVRHAFNLASIQIIRKGDKIPFDVQQGRTIIIDASDPYTIMDRIVSAKAELTEHVKAILSGTNTQEDSPIRMYLPKLSVKFG